jgi:hypothetical protein
MDAVVHAGVIDFQNESGALTLMQVGRLAQKAEAEGQDRRMAPESDLNIAFENGKTNFGSFGADPKVFAYLEIALFLSSVTGFGRIGI